LSQWWFAGLVWLLVGGFISGYAYQRLVPPHQWPPRIEQVIETPAPHCFERFDGQAMQGAMWIDWGVIEARSGNTVLGRTVADAEGRFSVYLPVLPPTAPDAKFYFIGFWQRGSAGSGIELPAVFE